MIDPSTYCGDCMSQQDVLDKYFPDWANPLDFAISQIDGKEEILKTWRVCPYVDSYDICEDGQYWNELACECFAMYGCNMLCSAREFGTILDPRVMCSCIDEHVLNSIIYPDWATQVHILKAEDAGKLEGELKNNPIPSCRRRGVET